MFLDPKHVGFHLSNLKESFAPILQPIPETVLKANAVVVVVLLVGIQTEAWRDVALTQCARTTNKKDRSWAITVQSKVFSFLWSVLPTSRQRSSVLFSSRHKIFSIIQ